MTVELKLMRSEAMHVVDQRSHHFSLHFHLKNKFDESSNFGLVAISRCEKCLAKDIRFSKVNH